MNKKNGGLKRPSKYRNGSVARVPQVPGAFGRKPAPKKERKSISGFFKLGCLS